MTASQPQKANGTQIRKQKKQVKPSANIEKPNLAKHGLKGSK